MTFARRIIESPVDPHRPKGPKVAVNLAESPLTWLFARKLISHRQFAAGEALRSDYERAALSPGVTMRWDASGVKAPRSGGIAPDRSDRQIAAKARFDAALAAAGPGLSDILWRAICAGESVPEAERALGWPTRSGRLILALALDRVADFHRLP